LTERNFSHSSQSPSIARALLWADGLHIIGLGAATSLLVFYPFVRVVVATGHWAARRRLWALYRRAIHILLILTYFVALVVYVTSPDISDYCTPIGSSTQQFALLSGAPHRPAASGVPPAGGTMHGTRAAEACEAWPSLPPEACASFEPRRLHRPGMPLPVAYRCSWLNDSLTEAEALLLPGRWAVERQGTCLKGPCRLFSNARSMALEFGMLFLVGTYVTAYSRQDVAWAQKEQAIVVATSTNALLDADSLSIE